MAIEVPPQRDPLLVLEAQLNGLLASYGEACWALEVFVGDSIENVVAKKGEALGILQKVRTAPAKLVDDDEGRPRVEHHPDGGISLSLEPTERDALLHLLDSHSRLYDVHPQMLLSMALAHAYALFDALVSDVLFSAFCAKPEHLRSKENITYEDVLAFPSQEALIEALARRKVLKLMYGRLEDQLDHIAKNFRVDVADSEEVDVERLKELRDRRNLIVHNNGRANADYAARHGVAEGETLSRSPEDAKRERELLRNVGTTIAAGVREHFCGAISRPLGTREDSLPAPATGTAEGSASS
ncbi:hypothetical protein OPAG_08311 [Rhodococcus opacus PD630]|uniref:hypothetical protein n=1 Tax=Rhodococcus opacus TaxID=37919 RepID=UPI00029CBFF0|nr:hypothetical protein [Rhodococcus opacus]EHI39071.1 hypothetical protein OPAG_08311 [Rhodococcus opacus PD630]UDH01767.1 hypothetical protein K2Z90_008227 [Rhodococcus opacus PD630]